MKLPNGTELYISCELGASQLKIAAYSYGMFAGWLIGYKNHREQTVKIFPFKNIVRGVFSQGDFPIKCSLHDLPWEKKKTSV